jgi:hypothetical protein
MSTYIFPYDYACMHSWHGMCYARARACALARTRAKSKTIPRMPSIPRISNVIRIANGPSRRLVKIFC